jgi:O-antigen/teichoic acid export membrane protein
MLRKVIGTAGSRIFSALISFVLISINARLLGASDVGTIALLILGITLILLVSRLAGGASLIYLTPRHEVTHLYVPAAIWSICTPLLIAPLFGYFSWVPAEYTIDLMCLAMLRSLSSTTATILLGQERIQTNNLLDIGEILVLLLAVCSFYFLIDEPLLRHYLNALYIAYGFSALFGFLAIRSSLSYGHLKRKAIFNAVHEIVRHSFYIQTASFFQLLNYRLSYYLLEIFSGRAAVGVYAVGTRIAESVWIISKSTSIVQYATISNKNDATYSSELSSKLFRFSLLITALLLTFMLLLPKSLYIFIFGNEFQQIKLVLFGMSGGILALASSMSFSGYFSGIGKQSVNTTGSLIGLGLTIGFGLLLIPEYQLIGAAITSSLSYLSTTTYYTFRFLRHTNNTILVLIPRLDDFAEVRKHLGHLLKSKS